MFNYDYDFTEELLEYDEQVIISRYKLGVTLKEIIRMHGISYGKLYEILNRHNVPRTVGRYNNSASGDRLSYMSEGEKINLINDYENGMALSLIYSKYHINKHGCYTVLDEAQVPRRNKPFLIAIEVPLPVKRFLRRTRISNIMKTHLSVKHF